ncbi:unnamed protein product [Calicophoron daubneyi]|uniref:Phospholipase A-2-activating protein n=1 Tax=Calicophoron daubneyi TaxID=300641 RepID=A0AAV2T8E1_CALDB
MEYKFRCALHGHKGDVRCLSCYSEVLLVSASRDFTARTWHISKEGCDYQEGAILRGHENYVSALAIYKPSAAQESHWIFTGSHDKLIRAYILGQEDPSYILKGHEDTVCALAVDEHGTLISGSWDKCIKIWRDEKCLTTILGHEAAVWCILLGPRSFLSAPESDLVIVSGSADRQICVWHVVNIYGKDTDISYSRVKNMIGHSDCVRNLALVDDHRFLSASNDASIRAWDARDGSCVGEFYGHTNYVYGLATQPGLPIFVSSGEDRSVRIWPYPSQSQWGVGKRFACLQSIPVPCQSAWCVTLSPLGDVIVGGSDAVIRIFSADPARQASSDAIRTYEAELASSEIAAPNAGELDMNNLPGLEALLIPGSKEGQVIVVRQDNRSVCYQWSTGQSRWLEIGDVVGTQASNRQTFEGKEYDFVFTVDIVDGGEPLKLPYNRTQDPWFVAQEFIHRNNLPQDYLDTVAKFIVKNAGPQLNPPSEAELCAADPLTGGSRYIPGLNRTDSGSASCSLAPDSHIYFPSDSFLSLKAISLGPLMTKLEAFNKESDHPYSSQALDQMRSFSFDFEQSRAEQLAKTILEKLPNWPIDKMFPLLDLLRCLVCWPRASEVIFSATNWKFLREISVGNVDAPPANYLLILRLMANAIAADSPKFFSPIHVVAPSLTAILDLTSLLSQLLEKKKTEMAERKQHQIAFSTLLHNIAVLAHLSSKVPTANSELPRIRVVPSLCIRMSLILLSLGPDHGPGGVTLFHPEAIFNLFVCLGTSLLSLSSDSEKTTEEVKTQRVRLIASAASSLTSSATVPNDATEAEFAAWEKARSVISFWAFSPATLPKIRSSAAALLHLLD